MTRIKPEVCEGCRVPKGWGEELIIENNEKYCGKLLIFKAGCKFSMHYHMIKDETWYVESGEFIYRWIDTETADVHEQHLKPGNIVRQPMMENVQYRIAEDLMPLVFLIGLPLSQTPYHELLVLLRRWPES